MTTRLSDAEILEILLERLGEWREAALADDKARYVKANISLYLTFDQIPEDVDGDDE